MKDQHIILGVTGSIAAFKAADLTARLVAADARVTVILTASAQQFIRPLTFRSLTPDPVITDLWQQTGPAQPVHVSIAARADLLLVAPATANIIGKMANGLADDMLSCTAISVACPIVIAPAMNDCMYGHPVVQQNITKLRELGCTFVGPEKGRLASGRVGMGRLADLDVILRAAEDALAK